MEEEKTYRATLKKVGETVKKVGVKVAIGVLGIVMVCSLAACNKNKEAEVEQTGENVVIVSPQDQSMSSDEYQGLLDGKEVVTYQISQDKKAKVLGILSEVVGEESTAAEIVSGVLVQKSSGKQQPISVVVGVRAGAQNALVSAKTKLSGDISARDFKIDLDTLADTLIDAYDLDELRSVITDDAYVAPDRAQTLEIESSILKYTTGKSVRVATNLSESSVNALKTEFGKMLNQEGSCSLINAYVVDSKVAIDAINDEGKVVRRTMDCSEEELAAFNGKTTDAERLAWLSSKCKGSEAETVEVPEDEADVSIGTSVFGDTFLELADGGTVITNMDVASEQEDAEEQGEAVAAQSASIKTAKATSALSHNMNPNGYSNIPPRSLGC